MNLQSHQKQASSKQQQHRAAKLHHHPWHFKTNQDNSLIEWPYHYWQNRGILAKRKEQSRPGLFPINLVQHARTPTPSWPSLDSCQIGQTLLIVNPTPDLSQNPTQLRFRPPGKKEEKERESYVPAFHESTTTALLLRRRLSILRSISRRILLGISLRRRISLLGISLRGISRRRISVFGISLRWIT